MHTDANDPGRQSWVEVAADSDFPIQNLPFGIVQPDYGPARVASAIGSFGIDLAALADLGIFEETAIDPSVFRASALNAFMALGRSTTRLVRNRLSWVLDARADNQTYRQSASRWLFPLEDAALRCPVDIGDYTDFYSSREHATNVGSLFRDPARALPPNWLHLPIAYHGRASSIVVSGTPVYRPSGQRLPAGSDQPVYGPSAQLDFELEMGLVIGQSSELGRPIPTDRAEDHLFGMVLFNDWSARDIQRWEYQPLGPFLGKNFASTIAPWVVTLDALQPFQTAAPEQHPEPLAYLKTTNHLTYDIELRAQLQTAQGVAVTLCRTNYSHLYWTPAQQLAHHTVNGCNVRTGDLLASGTISGNQPDSYGSLLELTRGGAEALELPDGSHRTFLEDGDSVTLRGWCQGNGYRIGFGAAEARILPTQGISV